MGLMEQSVLKKYLGKSVEFLKFKFGVSSLVDLKSVNSLINGADFSDNGFKVKTLILRGKSTNYSSKDLNSVFNYQFRQNFKGVNANFIEFFTKFRVSSGVKRMLTTTKSLVIGDNTYTKSYITGCDVIHS